MIKLLTDNFDKILPIVSLVIGSLMTMIASFLSDRRQRLKEKDLRIEQRLDSIRIKRNEGQREVLLALLDALAVYIRFVGRAHNFDEMNARKSGAEKSNLLPEEIDQGLLNSQVTVSKLHFRVRNEEIRSLINQLKSECVEIEFQYSQSKKFQTMQQVTITYGIVSEKIGIEIRKLDDDDQIIQLN